MSVPSAALAWCTDSAPDRMLGAVQAGAWLLVACVVCLVAWPALMLIDRLDAECAS